MATNTARNTMEDLLTQLETLLKQETAGHEALLSLAHRKTDALRHGDTARLTDVCKLENQKLQAVAELAKQRLALVGELTQALEPDATQPLRLMELAEHLPEPARGRILVLRAGLRDLMGKVQHDNRRAGRAMDAIVRHMQGVAQSIGSRLTGVGTYTHKGHRPAAATAVNTLSLTA